MVGGSFCVSKGIGIRDCNSREESGVFRLVDLGDVERRFFFSREERRKYIDVIYRI